MRLRVSPVLRAATCVRPHVVQRKCHIAGCPKRRWNSVASDQTSRTHEIIFWPSATRL